LTNLQNYEKDGNMREVIIGIDIGGTGTRILAMTPSRDVVARKVFATPAIFPAETATEFLIGRIRDVAAGVRPVAIGIGASGPIDAEGTIQNPDTLAGFTGAPLRAGLQEAFGVPVAIDNDAVCAALAENTVGAGRGYSSLLHVTLGTGIGAAFLIDGIPVRSGDGQHPEAGHLSVSGETIPCYCGRTSCWEQAASRQVLQRAASSLLGVEATNRSAIDRLAARAHAGNTEALRIFHNYGSRVAEGLSTLLAIYRPHIIVLGGSAAEYLPFFQDVISESLADLGQWISQAKVIRTELDDYGGAIGGALLALAPAA
jgi:glucokinase